MGAFSYGHDYGYTPATPLYRCFRTRTRLIQTQMAQKPMLRAEVRMRVCSANKASAEWFRRERGIGQIPRKKCKKRGICGCCSARAKKLVTCGTRGPLGSGQSVPFSAQGAYCSVLFCPWAMRGFDGTGTPSPSAEWQWIENPPSKIKTNQVPSNKHIQWI